MKLDEKQAEAVRHLQHDQHFRSFMGAIGDYAEHLNQQLLFNRDIDLHELRGRAQAVVNIIQAIDAALKH